MRKFFLDFIVFGPYNVIEVSKVTKEEQLKQIILSSHKSLRAFTEKYDIPYSTLDSLLRRGIKNAGVGTVVTIFTALGLDVESCSDQFERLEYVVKTDVFDNDEQLSTLVALYNQMDEAGRESLLGVMRSMKKSK